MWVVFDSDNQIVIITDKKEEAVAAYEDEKAQWRKVIGGDELGDNEMEAHVILAKIERHFYLAPIGENIADFKEKTY
ncbi:hypothetical protein E4665_17750 [Sporolactobacillus shoreae]|uniref:Uncharacterized protein n=1 Tax=Sporolactobacillus shoreae TaxID=1465501 RepID=A0A4Z0GH12_9BACL|nr:hypothetical protein [Sporolactobacillus shoreae]TGA95653.1 hypothetical protein E4665_17750 [Sporolactobacillus shoreae]